jgi:cellulose synthase/poly-beta-1,6-N-acetylglucosamine synthase-like glycosyltransferase
MRISILIPCHNEGKSIQACVDSCLDQTRPADEIVVVDDGSTDNSAEILKQYGDAIKVITIPYATGNKSRAQERALDHITGDVFIATDGDTLLDPNFVEEILKPFEDPAVAAAGGYIKSLEHNWLTALREMDYLIGQDLHKRAQAFINALFVIPGCAGAFRTDVFREVLTFDHDTVTEDLDFTYKLHKNYYKIAYAPLALVYTQDPSTLFSYIQQMRRWYGGGWQNLLKHFKILRRPANALQLTLIYVDGLAMSTILFGTLFLEPQALVYLLLPHLVFSLLLGIYTAVVRKRWGIVFASPLYTVLLFVNAGIFVEQFVREFVLRQTNLVWHSPLRRPNLYIPVK